ncbi:hypothetical protein INR49_029539 [Caranx melampygus]|nr:hypothetical protein INR49_029539 [Caranx melampygus]
MLCCSLALTHRQHQPNLELCQLSCPEAQTSAAVCLKHDNCHLHLEPGRYRNPFHRNNQTRTLHIENSNKVPISCEASSCTFAAAIPHLEQYNIKLVVKDQLGEEAERHSFNISDRVGRSEPWNGRHHYVLAIKENLTQLDLICQVSVNPGSTTELNCSRPSSLCRVKLQHLLPDTVYSTTVRCSVNGRLWGPWTQPLAFKTCPFMTLNLWRSLKQMSETNSRLVTLLWQLNVPGSGTTETIQGYLVQWLQDGQNRTEWRGSAQTQAEVSISSGQYNFTVQAVSHTCPPITAHITIPKFGNRGQQHMESETLQVERRLSSSPAGGFNLSWPELDSLATCGYIENVHRLLEVQTGYSQELRPKQQPHLVEPAQSTSSSVTLEWSYNEYDPSHPAFITGYLVTIQELGSNTLPDHTASVLLEDPQRKSVTIDGLKENHEYKFYVSALTKAGPGQQGMITVWTRTDYSTHLAEILTPILLLLGCAILMWPRRKTLRRGLKEIFIYPAGMNIKPFEMESFLNEVWTQSNYAPRNVLNLRYISTFF